MTALPRASLGTLLGRRREMRCIFALFARRHCRGREMRNANPPRAATLRDQLLESDAHTSIKRVRARRKAGTRLPRRRTLESAAATNRFALLASFVPQGVFFLRCNGAESPAGSFPASLRLLEVTSHPGSLGRLLAPPLLTSQHVLSTGAAYSQHALSTAAA